MSNFSDIGLINNSSISISIKNVDYTDILSDMSLKEFNKIKSYENYRYLFFYDGEHLYLKDLSINITSIYVDFTVGAIDYRRKTSGIKQEILKAIGINNNKKILDTTAGLCKDSFIFATYGLKVVALEQNPLIYNITKNGLEFAINNPNTQDIVKNIKLINTNSIDFLKNNECDFDCIYLDPMFPKKTKSSLCKKEMQLFHNLAFYGDNEELFNLSMLKTKNRVVVKRMINNEYIVNKKPSYQIFGKTIRYDVYLK